MKRRIARYWLAFAEISGRRVPHRVEAWLGDEAAWIRRREDALTRQLRETRPAPRAAPANLDFRIEAAVRADRRGRQHDERWAPLGAMTVALAAVVFVVGALSWRSLPINPKRPEEFATPVVDHTTMPLPAQATPRVDATPVARWARQLDDPLLAERDRLVADLAAAAELVARNFVPSDYLPEIEAALEGWGSPAG